MRFLILIFAIVIILQHKDGSSQALCDIPNESVSAIPGVAAFNNFDLGVQCAIESNKPIFLFFTGWACVSSRKMEEEILTDPSNLSLLQDEFVVICLYVDDKRALPESEIETWTYNKVTKVTKTIGDRNCKIQVEKFNNNSQPLALILSSDGEREISCFGYTPEVAKVNSMILDALDSIKN
jgi:hypothetical protein